MTVTAVAPENSNANGAPTWVRNPSFCVGCVPSEFEWTMEHLAETLNSDCEVLDVAAGDGGLSRMLAPHVGKITALDCDEVAVQNGTKECEGFANVTYKLGDAENMPFVDHQFDIVACRFALHQFEYPLDVLQEMLRVCKPSGKVIIMDVLSPDMPKHSARYNILAKQCDDAHVCARTQYDLTCLVKQAGMPNTKVIRKEVPQQLEAWMARGTNSEHRRESIREAVIQEFEGGRTTGLRPYLEGSDLCCVHSHALIIASR